jgi:hypothetical protein
MHFRIKFLLFSDFSLYIYIYNVDSVVVKSGKIGADFKTFRMNLPIPLFSTFLLSTTTTIPAGAG